ncbi:hypothetical protein [Pseudonocardia sp. GCM10023141]|uniref:COG4315 family predicted lipoprotein n=1 Tax=Pseudonocardia sp. GCM10023141 TaxID=3252653 RepID=UPI00360A53DE
MTTRSLRSLPAATVLLAALIPLAACGSTMQAVPAREAPPVGGAAVAGPPPAGGLAATSTSFGTVVTSDGFTLYRFDKDKPSPSTSTCTGSCATSWPPVLGDGVPAVRGIPQQLIGTVGRPDGSQQLTLGGWPLYRFAKDAEPGDVNGEGVNGAWRAVGVDGKPAAAPTPAPTPAESGGSSGY